MEQTGADIFQALADPSRRHILQLLSTGSMTINALAKNFEMSRPAVSKHIRILNETGFISIEDKGRERYCFLKEEGFEQMRAWLSYYDDFWKEKLTALEQLLNKS